MGKFFLDYIIDVCEALLIGEKERLYIRRERSEHRIGNWKDYSDLKTEHGTKNEPHGMRRNRHRADDIRWERTERLCATMAIVVTV